MQIREAAGSSAMQAALRDHNVQHIVALLLIIMEKEHVFFRVVALFLKNHVQKAENVALELRSLYKELPGCRTK